MDYMNPPQKKTQKGIPLHFMSILSNVRFSRWLLAAISDLCKLAKLLKVATWVTKLKLVKVLMGVQILQNTFLSCAHMGLISQWGKGYIHSVQVFI